MDRLKVFAIAGSARSSSLNRRLLRVAIGVLEKNGAEVDHWDVAERPLPMYEQRLEESGRFPDEVKDLRRRILEADAVTFASPEYNAGVTPLLKSVIDWGSRPDPETGQGNVWAGKPVVVVGASPGPFGTSRVQIALRQTFAHVGLLMLGEGLTLMRADKAFDESGALTDETAAKALDRLIHKFVPFALAAKASAAQGLQR